MAQARNDVFGIHRTGREIRERYGKVLDLLERDGRVVRREAVLALSAGQLSGAPAGAGQPGPGVQSEAHGDTTAASGAAGAMPGERGAHRFGSPRATRPHSTLRVTECVDPWSHFEYSLS